MKTLLFPQPLFSYGLRALSVKLICLILVTLFPRLVLMRSGSDGISLTLLVQYGCVKVQICF